MQGAPSRHLAEVQAQDQTEAREREKRIDERMEKMVTAIGGFEGRLQNIKGSAVRFSQGKRAMNRGRLGQCVTRQKMRSADCV